MSDIPHRGRKPLGQPKIQRTVKLSEDIDMKLRHAAVDLKVTDGELVERALRAFLELYRYDSSFEASNRDPAQ
ncbi:MAG: hypothetical protein IH869_00040 [Chloroflexi bacterium]|nr:hypothetical protein [Chloroflexota bacterium]